MPWDETRSSLLLSVRDPQNSEAWREFFSIYGPAVRAYAARRGVRESDLDDLVQETFLAVSTLIRRFEYDRTRGRFRSWLRSIADRRIAKCRSAASTEAKGNTLPDEVEDPGADLEGYWDRQWRELVLERAIGKAREHVEPRTFEAFRRYVLEAEPAGEVAGHLGVSRAYVYVCKTRVLGLINQALGFYDA